jgi:hypothetical protein
VAISWRSGWIRCGGAPRATVERQRSERDEQGSSSRTGAVGRTSAEMWFPHIAGASSSFSPKLAELTPLPPNLGLASANCAARVKGIHVEVDHATDEFASSLAGSVKQAANGGACLSSTTDK